ncbi:MAG: glutamate--tRNA ligase family protein, partial [Desulfovibrionales bacterium]|nr:glutamate--tRNA ligase family protein [Desulfovibrionales bacterium]
MFEIPKNILDRIPETPVSRLAPTPSGFLHLGNAVNFLITWAWVRSRDGVLHLRIDDMDGVRFRRDVLEDIFFSLNWLGVDWDQGPKGPSEFLEKFSLQHRRPHYLNRLGELGEKTGRVFTCVCSRSAIKKISSTGLYPQTCRGAGHVFVPGQNALRLQVDAGTQVRLEGQEIRLDETFGDFILWRRDDQPSYQLASLVEDEEAGVNFIVRGEDLLLSTAAQLHLAHLFEFRHFPRAVFVH